MTTLDRNRVLQLGLIGDHIHNSRSPLLHRLAGRQSGMEVRYASLIPPEMGQDFDAVFEACRSGGYRGVNVTYPYKERVTDRVRVADPLMARVGAVNTVIFGPEGPEGHNTDFTGFAAAYRRMRGETAPGPVLMIGTGGVGRAVAFALVALGGTEIRLVDRDRGKAERLAAELRRAAPDLAVAVGSDAAEAASGAAGLINCTPLGMDGRGGSPLPAAAMAGAAWAFDAVYTPRDTLFMRDAEAAGLDLVSGWELFFYQGVHAWELFAGAPLDEARLRADLQE
ncbi:shikimate dehydrogenase family protein [Roseivivax sp. CAU 1761]